MERAFPAGRLPDRHLRVGDGVQVAVGRDDAGAAHPLAALARVGRGRAEGRRRERPRRRVGGGAFAELGLPRGRGRGEHLGVVADRSGPGCGEGGPVPVAHRALGGAAAVLEQPDAVAQHVGDGVRVVQTAAADGLGEHRVRVVPGQLHRPGPRTSAGRSRARRPAAGRPRAGSSRVRVSVARWRLCSAVSRSHWVPTQASERVSSTPARRAISAAVVRSTGRVRMSVSTATGVRSTRSGSWWSGACWQIDVEGVGVAAAAARHVHPGPCGAVVDQAVAGVDGLRPAHRRR